MASSNSTTATTELTTDVDTIPRYIIIRDVMSDDHRSGEILEEQLESAFESRVPHIIIEPALVGDEVSKWITVGNFLHKTSVISGVISLLTPLICPTKYRYHVSLPLSGMNLLCMVVYNFSWQHDPCCKYQIEGNSDQLEHLQLQTLASKSPVILVRRDDKYRKRMHNFFAICVAGCVGWTIFSYYRR